jgi:hypothetical protein
MDVLKITPPFFYSYQCGSFLLTSYIPVYMYSISLQLIASIATLAFIIFPSSVIDHPYSSWFLKLFPRVCWVNQPSEVDTETIRLVSPHQIISRMMNSILLLLSFGLCSPVLCCYIALSICVHLSCWLILIGRFVGIRTDALAFSQFSSLGTFSLPSFI